ncbi:MAG TPA: type I secretion system permease/ATPase [Caulobacteraceae bacterium]
MALPAQSVRVNPAAASAGEGPLREALKLCSSHLRFAILFSAIVNLAYLAPTLYMLQVYDRVVPSGSRPTLLFITVALSACLFLLTYLDRMRSRLLLAAGVRLNEAFTGRIFRRALAGAGAGRPLRLNQMMRDFDTIRAAISGPAALALFDTPWIPIYIITCFIVHPAIGALALFGAVLLAGLALLNERATHDVDRRAAQATAAGAYGQEAVSASADVIRSLGMSSAFQAQFEDARARTVSPQLEAARSSGRIAGLIRFMRLFLQSVALGAGAWLAIDHQVSSGAIFASSMLAARALSPIDLVVANWRTLSAAVTSYDALKEHLQKDAPHAATELPRPTSRLTVVAATAMAGARPLLEKVTFEASAGQVVGVIGPSGSGKTTLLQLIANARACDEGEVRLDGARLSDWDIDRLGRFIGYVPQDAALFAGSIKDNISRFDTWRGVDAAAVDRDTIEAAREAEIHELILTLPQGYDTLLGPRGRGLSAGQQQRVALARALYGGPMLYVLDEPNSNVDADGEAALMRLLARLKAQGAIVLMAVHRASLIGAVDLIVQLRGGRLERVGARDAVLAALQAPARRPPAAQVAGEVE